MIVRLKKVCLIIQAQGNVIRFCPPLIVEKEHIDQMVEKMRRILA